MKEGIETTTPDREKAKSIMKMVDTTLKMIESVDSGKFASNVLKEYYETIRELMSVVLLLDGLKTTGEGAHKKLIEYVGEKYDFSEYEVSLLDDLRITRNRIAYDGFFITPDYLKRKKKDILQIILKLKQLIKGKSDD